MENSTVDFNQSSQSPSNNAFLANILTNGILSVITLYLLAAFGYYHWYLERLISFSRLSQLSLEQKYALASKLLCMAIGVVLLVREIMVFVIMWLEKDFEMQDSLYPTRNQELICQVSTSILATSLIVIIGFVSVFLWIRQRVFYIHPSLKFLNNKFFKFLSYLCISFWILSTTSIMTSYFVLIRYKLMKNIGCVTISLQNGGYLKNLVLSLIASSTVVQTTLLGLFIYPILKRVSWKVKSRRNNKKLLRRVKKAVILTSICLSTDVFCFLVAFIVQSFSYFNVYTFNLLTNFVVSLFYFDHWKILFWPWTAAEKRRKPSIPLQSRSLENASHNDQTFVE